MKTTTLFSTAALCAVLVTSPLTPAQARDGSEMFSGMMKAYTTQPASAASKNFVKKATIGGMFEVQSSQLALQKSRNESIKDFAEEMVEDHTEANEDLKDAVADSSVDQSAIPTKLDAKHRAILKDLQKASGRSFDDQYVKAQTDGHKEAVALFTDYSRNGDDPVLKEFASDTLPTLKDHKRKIMDIKSEKAADYPSNRNWNNPSNRDWNNSNRDWNNPDYR